jgi:soluble lytic murein transglycosylase-like protein
MRSARRRGGRPLRRTTEGTPNTYRQEATHATEPRTRVRQPRCALASSESARRATLDTDWGQETIEDELAQDPDSPEARCPRFAGIVEESGDQAVIVAETEEELAEDMAARLTSEIPIRPIELIDLDTDQQWLAFCEATVRFASAEPAAQLAPAGR